MKLSTESTLRGSLTRFPAPVGAALLLLLGALLGDKAQAYAEFGYYAGAWSATNSGNCVGEGSNPYGGCTPLTFPLSFAHAQQTDPTGRFASATADLASAGLKAATVIQNRENGSGAAANFMDTITIVGSLPTPIDISFTMRVDSTFVVASDAGQYDVQASLVTGSGVVASYIRTTPGGDCSSAIIGGAACTASDGSDTYSITRSVTVSDANRSFMLGATLFAGGWTMTNDAQVQLSLQLPAGLDYTSASGVFAVRAVPEPHSWVLWGLGLATLLGRRRLVAAAQATRRQGSPRPARQQPSRLEAAGA